MGKTSDLNKLVFIIGKRYGKFDSFVWCDKLNLEINWKEFSEKPLTKTIYFLDEPIIMMSNSIKYSTQRYFVLAHEIGHVLEHQGLTFLTRYMNVKQSEKLTNLQSPL